MGHFQYFDLYFEITYPLKYSYMYPVRYYTVGCLVAQYDVIMLTINICDVIIWRNVISDVFSIFLALPFFANILQFEIYGS